MAFASNTEDAPILGRTLQRDVRQRTDDEGEYDLPNTNLTRRTLARGAILGLPAIGLATAAPAFAAGNIGNPGKSWAKYARPEDGGFKSSALAAAEEVMYAKPTTSLMVVRGGKVVYEYGDTSQVSYLASSRKSVLSMLYGKYVESGQIKLDQTIGSLGVDERGAGLTAQEKSATIRDLLTSSSGVYWPAGSPGGDESTPARGSYKPGAHFHYNNWDFNVAGAVFEQLTGKSVFRALDEDLARPLQFQDFDINRQRMLGYQSDPSRYKAYHMFLSGRDMARLGLVMVNGGVWNGKQIIPATWVEESTAVHVKGPDMQDPKAGIGYAYLWWKPSEGRTGARWKDSYLANGNFGQYILGLPAIDTVIVHRRAVTDQFAIARNLGKTKASPAGGNVDFLAVADIIVNGMT